MFDDLIFALKNFRRNKVRSILSLLGIIIGVASVIVITSLSQSATKSIKDSYNSASLDIVRVSAGFMSRRRNAAITFDETFRQDLFNSVKDIKNNEKGKYDYYEIRWADTAAIKRQRSNRKKEGSRFCQELLTFI